MGNERGATVKRASDRLVELRGQDAVVRYLADAGFSVSATVKELLGSADLAGALLVGSVAEGYQNASSDIDILLLTYADREDVRTSSNLVIESGSSLETLTYADGVEVNIEIICREDFDSLAGTLDRVVGAVALGGQLRTLPLVDNYSLRFLHRLRTGLVLHGSDVVEEFRADFHVQSLPLYLSVTYVVMARECLEDARASPRETTGLVEFVCRNVTEYCLLALAAANGFTSTTRRFVMNWLAALPEDAEHSEALRGLRTSLLERRDLPADQKADLVAECDRQFEYVREALRADPVRRKVIDQIFSRISYAG